MIINLPNNIQFRVYMSKLEKRTGVCSQQFNKPDSHVLLWDFDYSELDDIVKSLMDIQKQYNLPSIYVIQSSPDSYHAYCFTSRTFREIINILSATKQIDMTYLRLGIVRGYFTLRITPRKNEPNFKLVKTLESGFINEVSFMDITINDYLTSNKGGKYNAKR